MLAEFSAGVSKLGSTRSVEHPMEKLITQTHLFLLKKTMHLKKIIDIFF